MTIASYVELQAAVAGWTHRSDLAARTGEFIALGEARLNRRLRTRRMLRRAVAVIDGPVQAAPADFLAVETFRLNAADRPLDARGPDAMSRWKAERGGAAGTPTSYAVVGEAFEFGPAPAGAHAATLTYYAALPALSEAEPSNWLLASAPDAYLWAALLGAADYLHDDAMTAKYGALFEAAVGELERADREDAAAGRLTPAPSVTV